MKISIVLQALTGTFETDMKRAARETERAAKKMQKDWEQSGKAIGKALAGAATAFGVLFQKSLNGADQLSKLSQKVGISVESLSALKYQAGLAGVEIDQLETGLKKFNKSIGDAAGGSKIQLETFKAMGISIRDAGGKLKDTQTLLGEVADKFATYEDGAAKTTLAMNLFGRSGADMIVQLNGGRKAMAEAAKEADDLGQIIGTNTAKQAEQFNDNMRRAGLLAAGFGNALAAKLLPSLVNLSDEFIRGAKESRSFETAADAVAGGLKALAQVAIVTKGAIEGLTNFVAASVDTLVAFGRTTTEAFALPLKSIRGVIKLLRGDVEGAKGDFGGDLFDSFKQGAADTAKAWASADTGIQDALDRSKALFESIDKPLKAVEERGKAFQNVIGGVGEYVAKVEAPVAAITGGTDKAAKAIEKLTDGIATGQQRLADMADSFAQFSDPVDEVMAKFRDQIIDVGRAAEEQQAKIDALAASGKGEEAAAAQVAMQDAITLATQNAIESRDASIASIQRERDVTSAYVADLANEARLIGLTATQQRVESVVMRALTEAKKANAAAGKEIIKVDEARIRQQAKLNEALNIAAQINQKSPIFEMIDQAETLGEQIRKGVQSGFDPELLKPFEDALSRIKTQIAIENIEAFKSLLGAAQTFTKEGSKGFKTLEKGMAALSLIQNILAFKAAVTSILSQGQAPPPFSFAAMAAMAAAVAPLLASIGQTAATFSGGDFGNTAASRQATQGTGSVLGDANAKSESIANATEITADATSKLVGLNRGMLDALRALQSALGAASNQLARGAGQADFSGLNLAVASQNPLGIPISESILDPLGILGGSSKITDEGIIIFAGALQDLIENVAVGAYQEVQSTSWIFGSTHTNEGIMAVSDAFARQFSLIVSSIADAVRAGAEALGILPDEIQAALDAFQVAETRISLQDLSAEDQQAALEAVFSQIFDGLAGAVVPFIEQFQQVGEGLGETLIRVATEVQVTQEAMRQLGLVINETDPERFAQISDSLITAVGGIDAFIQGMTGFVNAFAPASQQLQIATDALTSAFEQAGLTLPETRDAMWALLQTMDATTEEGRDQIATLLRLSDVAAQYYDLLDKAEKARLDYIIRASDLQTELGQGGGFIGGRASIQQWAADMERSLNELAQAAGRAGASQSDLENVERVAAQRLQQLIAQLKSQLRDLAVTLGYTTPADTIESLNAQIESLSSTSSDAAGAIGSAIDSMREKMNLLLGDLSPLNDQKKLEIALEGLRNGTVDASQVLEIGRRLYASTSNYTNLFNEVMRIAQLGQPGGSGSGSSSNQTADGRTLQELIAARDALIAAQRPELADQLAQRIAEIAFATGEDFAAIAEQQGFTLDQLGSDLMLNGEQLNAYLQTLVDQFESQNFGEVGAMITDAIQNSTDRIVEAITGEPQAAIETSDQRMREIAAEQKQDRLQSDQRLVDAIDRQTAAIIAAASGDSADLEEVLQQTRRDLRETVLSLRGEGDRGTIGLGGRVSVR